MERILGGYLLVGPHPVKRRNGGLHGLEVEEVEREREGVQKLCDLRRIDDSVYVFGLAFHLHLLTRTQGDFFVCSVYEGNGALCHELECLVHADATQVEHAWARQMTPTPAAIPAFVGALALLADCDVGFCVLTRNFFECRNVATDLSDHVHHLCGAVLHHKQLVHVELALAHILVVEVHEGDALYGHAALSQEPGLVGHVVIVDLVHVR